VRERERERERDTQACRFKMVFLFVLSSETHS
jgi:hypothetical protein